MAGLLLILGWYGGLVALQDTSGPPSSHRWTCEYQILDRKDEVRARQRITAAVRRDPERGVATWSDGEFQVADGADGAFGEPQALAFLEGFEYAGDSGFRMLLPTFFTGFPADTTGTYARNLVWDTHMLEDFARRLPELELNQVKRPQELQQSAVPLAGLGTFRNREVELLWVGTSRRNDRPCAVIQYEAYLNRFEITLPGAAITGLSHYWGTIWVSLADRDVEFATLHEHVTVRPTDRPDAAPQVVLRHGSMERVAEGE